MLSKAIGSINFLGNHVFKISPFCVQLKKETQTDSTISCHETWH